MATNIVNAFTISENGLSLNEEAMILHGADDPSLAPGQEAPVGSLYLRTGTAELYQKSGPTDTDWTLVNAIASGSNSIPVVQLLRSSNQALTTGFVDLNFDITDLETDSTVLEHDNVNTDRILIKETGLYKIQYSLSIDANSGENTFNIRVRINDTAVIPASNREISEDDKINAVSNIFHVELTAGDFITMQIKSDGNGDVLWDTGNFSINKASGIAGAIGPAGSGTTINIQEDGVNIPNTPHSSLNFGSGIDVIDTPAGALISVPPTIFGSEFHQAESLGVTTTTSNSFQEKLLLTTGVLPAGKYRIGISYGWNFNSTGRDFVSDIREDGNQIGELHTQEPKDTSSNFSATGTNQRHYINRTFYRTLTPGSHTFQVRWRSQSSGTSASIWDCNIELWRVS